MKAYVTTIGEKTAEICVSQLERFGFEVILSSMVEPWHEKYRRFIETTDEDILRVDADIILNERIVDGYKEFLSSGFLMGQWTMYDFYRNDLWIGQPVAYTKKALAIIRENLKTMDQRRPETWASRLPEINPNLVTSSLVIGMHGFFQDEASLSRHYQHKKERGQLEHFDFELADKILKL